MATSDEIEMKYPRILFLDGSMGIIYRSHIPTGSPEQVKLIILPHGPSIRASGIANDMTFIDEPSPLLSVHGNQGYINHYGSNSIVPLSHNPEWSVYLGLCNIKGERISVAAKEFAPMYKLQMKVDGLMEQVKDLQLENSALRERNRELIVITQKRFKEEMALAGRDEKFKRITAGEFLGTVQTKEREGE